jgi:hypothetical protein
MIFNTCGLGLAIGGGTAAYLLLAQQSSVL